MTSTPAELPSRRAPFGDLSVSVKVIAAVVTAAVVALIVGVVGLVSLAKTSNSAQLIYRSNVASIRAVGQLKSVVTQARVDLANQALSADDASTKKFGDAYFADLQSFKTAMAAYRQSMPAADPQLITSLQTNWDA